MSGPSSTQLQLQQEQMQFYQQGQQQSQKTFAEQQDLLSQMEKVYEPILARGPSQEGFSPAELENLNSQAEEGTATSYQHAARAVNAQLATQGNGNPLPSGGEEQIKEEVANSAADSLSKEESQILQADYAQGFKEFEDAGSALSVASGQLDPAKFEQAATSAGSAAETTAKDINAEQNSWEAPVFGALGALGGAVMTGGLSLGASALPGIQGGPGSGYEGNSIG